MTTDGLQRIARLADAVHNLLDAAAGQQEITHHQLDAIEKATNQMNTASARLKQSGETLRDDLAKEVRKSLQNASKEAATILSTEFTTANDLAKEAGAIYQSAVNWAAWRIFVFAAGIFVLLVATAGIFIWLTVPSHEEIMQLRAEKAELQTTISALEKRGGHARLSPCYGNRLCVQVYDQNSGPYWAIVDGY